MPDAGASQMLSGRIVPSPSLAPPIRAWLTALQAHGCCSSCPVTTTGPAPSVCNSLRGEGLSLPLPIPTSAHALAQLLGRQAVGRRRKGRDNFFVLKPIPVSLV